MPTLTPRQFQAASLIAGGRSQRQVAQALGVTYQTVNVWAQLPAFKTQVQSILGESQQSTLYILRGQRLKALEELSNLLDNAPPAVKLQAIRVVLEATQALPALPPSAMPDPDGLRFALSESHDLLNALGHFTQDEHANQTH